MVADNQANLISSSSYSASSYAKTYLTAQNSAGDWSDVNYTQVRWIET